MRGFIFLVALCFAAPAAAQDTDSARAATDLRTLCNADRGRLWGVSLCGPLLVVDPGTRAVWASDPDQEGQLRQSGDGWTGTLPAGVPVANSAVNWAGVRWIMLIGPLPTDAADRRVLVGHEAWHRAQDQIGLAMGPSDNTHLASERGRYFMRLEMRALASALRSSGNARERAARDALAFRRARYGEFPGAFAQEAALDRNEGLAAYTGVRLGADQPDIYAARTLDRHDSHEALARAYAYATGPAYGLLLDTYDEDWRRTLNAFAPADMLASVLRAPPYDTRELRRTAERYGGPTVAAEEQTRAQAAAAQRVALQQRYATGPRLELPLAEMQMEFDPNQVVPIEGLGSFYGRVTLRDRWGELVAAEGALIDPTFTRIIAAAPGPDGHSGPGWRLSLNPAWSTTTAADGVIRAQPRVASAPE